MIRIFPSLSFLINKHIYSRNYELIDSPNTIYFFGCCREGINETFRIYDHQNVSPRDKILDVIFAAEKEDRVCWRKLYDSYLAEIKDDTDRVWLQSKTGIEIPRSEIRDVRNLPDMKEFFAKHPSIQYLL